MSKQTNNHLTRIETVLMAVSIDPHDRTEGGCAIQTPAGWMPLIAADPARETFVREQAKLLAMASRIPIILIRLTGHVEIASISPDGTETSLS